MTQKPEELNAKFSTARKATQRSIHDCAGILGISNEQYMNFEKGSQGLSLPELEVLACYFGLPLHEILRGQPLDVTQLSLLGKDKRYQYLQMRKELIQTRLIQERQQSGRSLEDLEVLTGIPFEMLQGYEEAGNAIPFNHLQVLCEQLSIPMESLFSDELTLQDDSQMPPENWETNFLAGSSTSQEDNHENEEDAYRHTVAAMKKIPMAEQAQIAKFLLNQLKSI